MEKVNISKSEKSSPVSDIHYTPGNLISHNEHGTVQGDSSTISTDSSHSNKLVSALKRLQMGTTQLEAQFCAEVHKLQSKYHSMCKPFFNIREKIIAGTYEPSEEECLWSASDSDDGIETSDVTGECYVLELEPVANGSRDIVAIETIPITRARTSLEAELPSPRKVNEKQDATSPKNTEDKDDSNSSEAQYGKIFLGKNRKLIHPDDLIEPGIPEFWLTVFKNVELLSECVQKHDEAVLKYLTDIKIVNKCEPMSFVLEFYFSTNPFFTNNILTKEYFLKCEPDERDPLRFEGMQIYKSIGCNIDWQKGKDLTMKMVKKTQRHKQRRAFRVITQMIPNVSFFNFFSPPELPYDIDEADEEMQVILTIDFEVGFYFRERIIPRAVLFFTGEEE